MEVDSMESRPVRLRWHREIKDGVVEGEVVVGIEVEEAALRAEIIGIEL